MKQLTVGRVSTALGAAAFTLLTTASIASTLPIQVVGRGLPPAKYTQWTSNDDLFVRMRDEVHLDTDVLLPKGATGKLPTIFIKSPYFGEKASTIGDMRELWLRQGFAVVVQNERGLGLSEGSYRHYLQNAKQDGEDTLNWIVKQPWSNGKIGMIGCSSSGDTQPLAAANNNPALLATIPGGTWAVGSIPENHTQGVFYRGGVPYSGFWLDWYSHLAMTEHMVLPPQSTQAERVRLRNNFVITPNDMFDPTDPGAVTVFSRPRTVVDDSEFMVLPVTAILRKLGAALTPFHKYITYTPDDPRWNRTEFITASTTSPTPALHVTTLYDPAAVETTRWYHYLQTQHVPNQFLILGGGPHCIAFSDEYNREMSSSEKVKLIAEAPSGRIRRELAARDSFTLADMKFGDLKGGDARVAYENRGYAVLFLRWFNYWLRGVADNVTSMPKVQIYVMNEGWISGAHWPLASTRYTNYYLSGWSGSQLHWGTGALSTSPPHHAAENSYIYDPGNPTPSLGGNCCGMDVAMDQRPIEARNDVLVYSSAPLEQPVTIAGPVTAVLYVSSSARDTDFMVKLVDVYPDGKAVNLTETAFRVRYRDGYDKQVMMQRGQVYKIKLSAMVAAIKFPVGHRIRLDVASSNFPTFDRNLNTGGNNETTSVWVLARNTLHYGPRQRSHLVLPVIPDVNRRASSYDAFARRFRDE